MRLDVGNVLAARGGVWSDGAPAARAAGCATSTRAPAGVGETVVRRLGRCRRDPSASRPYVDRYRERRRRLRDSGSVASLRAVGMAWRWSSPTPRAGGPTPRRIDVPPCASSTWRTAASRSSPAGPSCASPPDAATATAFEPARGRAASRVAPAPGSTMLLANARRAARDPARVARRARRGASRCCARPSTAAPRGDARHHRSSRPRPSRWWRPSRADRREEEATRLAADVVPRLPVQPSPLAHAYAERLLAHVSTPTTRSTRTSGRRRALERDGHARVRGRPHAARARASGCAAAGAGPTPSTSSCRRSPRFEQHGLRAVGRRCCREELRAAGVDVDPHRSLRAPAPRSPRRRGRSPRPPPRGSRTRRSRDGCTSARRRSSCT